MSTYSTLNTARAAYLANADYADGAGDTSKANDFRSACRSLLVLLPASVGSNATSMSFSMAEISKALEAVEKFLAAAVSPDTAHRALFTEGRALL